MSPRVVNRAGGAFPDYVWRVLRYVEDAFRRNDRERFPTIREVSRGLRIRQEEVERAVEDCEYLDLAYFNVEGGWDDVPLGDFFVESYL